MKKILKKEFVEKLEKIYSSDDLKIVEKWFNLNKRKTVFRVNTLKTYNDEVEKILKENNIGFKKVSFLKNAYILDDTNESNLWDLDILKNGHIYLQSISSQIPVEILDIKEDDKILDITAAPGWKTSQISAIMKNTWEIIANDNNAIRIDKLKFTINRQWCTNVEVVKNDARNIWKNNPKYIDYFDKIIADLPCSAEWKFNLNNEKSYAYWSQDIVNKNYKLQKEIIKNIIPLLKDSWELIYSTCTISPEENEAIVHMILGIFPEMKLEEIKLDYIYARKWINKINDTVYRKEVEKTIRILPSTECEWFFIAKFKKIKELDII